MYVEILILGTLHTHPRHGYEIKRRVESLISHVVTINNNHLYPALRRFEEMGAITRTTENTPGKPDRHVYSLTDRGEEIFQGMLRDFPLEQARDDIEFKVRVAYFQMMDRDTCLEILSTRETILKQRLGFMEQMTVRAKANAEVQDFGIHILEFEQRGIQLELDWIDQLRKKVKK
jgi:DNA-binding PadR family transcriptional regulator